MDILKLVKTASVREHMDAHYRYEISYSKAVDLINEDANRQMNFLNISNIVKQRERIVKLLREIDLEYIQHRDCHDVLAEDIVKLLQL